MVFRSIREKINLKLYDSKTAVLNIFKILVFVVSIIALATLIYFYGFPQTAANKKFLLNIIRFSFIVYIVHYILRFIYDFEPVQFIKRTWFEGLIMGLLLIEGISFTFFQKLVIPTLFDAITHQNIEAFYIYFIHFYFLILIAVEISSYSQIIPKRIRLNPAMVFLAIFSVIIIGGALLLMMPEMTKTAGGISFTNALFTSTSAACVTGLIVRDTGIVFTHKGDFIIMMLIQVGGINIISFGTLIALFSKIGVGLKHHEVIEDMVNKNSVLNAKGMFRRVITWVVAIELVSATLLFFSWDKTVQFKSLGEKIFYSVFHSVSAFNNAGFSTFTDGLYNPQVRNNLLVHDIIGVTIFFGSLGLLPLFDIFSLKSIKERLHNPWKKLEVGTKIALHYSIGLVIAGMVFYLFLENGNTLAHMNILQKLSNSFFQSVTTRTAGFNTVNIAKVCTPMLLIFIVLMFIGASSSSTGGGIKTSTFALLSAATFANIRGKKNVEIYKRTISKDLIIRAFVIFIFFLLSILISVFLLSITESAYIAHSPHGLLDVVFETVSAYATVGLSTGVTPHLTIYGRYIIIASMFIGRVGLLTIVFLIGKRPISVNYKYPKVNTIVG